MNTSTPSGSAGLASIPSPRRFSIVRAVVLGFIVIAPAFAQMVLLSEERSVTASYYGSGIETHSSAGTFGLFEARATGTPFGGGFVSAYQKSNITPSEITVLHSTLDWYGAGGFAQTDFAVRFQLLQDTQIAITGYSNEWSGMASLVSDSLGVIPLVWGPPSSMYRNYLDFDDVLSPGVYTFSSMEGLRENWTTRIELRATAVPDDGVSCVLLGIALAGLVGARRWLT